ncbi:MAG TPA: amidohydrolase family protein [Bryobacteraceae bacterium]|nr:amidohydrolase family protein [Bryobacteraceae bacterium]
MASQTAGIRSEESGIDVLTGRGVTVRFGSEIESVSDDGAALSEVYVAPAWIDIQVNGFAGVDYNNPQAPHDEIARSIDVLFSTGVARFFPTVITGAPDDMTGALRNLADAKERLPEGGAIEGFHVEGPHISPDDGPRGAHPRRWVRKPDVHEFHRMQEAARGKIKVVTLSPEWPEAPRYIERLTEEGVTVSIGHMNADAAQIQAAVAAGARMSTHIGNGSHQTMQRHPNYIWEQLADDRLAAGFIVDGIHLGAAFLKVALRAKTTERAILVTDAAPPAAAAPGRYRLGEQDVDHTEDGRVVLAGTNRLAGSALRMDRGVGNLMLLAGLKLADAVQMATVNPARVTSIAGRQRGLSTGDRGDIVVFTYENHRIAIQRTYLSGRRVYSAHGV